MTRTFLIYAKDFIAGISEAPPPKKKTKKKKKKKKNTKKKKYI